jgi:hypothetical protein
MKSKLDILFTGSIVLFDASSGRLTNKGYYPVAVSKR